MAPYCNPYLYDNCRTGMSTGIRIIIGLVITGVFLAVVAVVFARFAQKRRRQLAMSQAHAISSQPYNSSAQTYCVPETNYYGAAVQPIHSQGLPAYSPQGRFDNPSAQPPVTQHHPDPTPSPVPDHGVGNTPMFQPPSAPPPAYTAASQRPS